MPPLLSVTSLTTALHSGVAIVDDISFAIRPGETLALLGESGCGKSMTAFSLMRLLPDGVSIAGGSMQLGGVEVASLPEREMRAVRGGKMAMIFQEPGLSLNPVMTVGAQIAEVLELHQSTAIAQSKTQPAQPDNNPPETISQRCVELLTQVGIPDPQRRLGEYPFQLSGGMKQRVMIAMALAGRPQLLIADEPTTALDVTIQAQVLQLLRDTQKQQGMAMLLITHDLGVVAENAHQVAVMYAGQIVERASCEQLFDAPAHPYTQKLFAAQPDGKRGGQSLAAIAGNVPALGEVVNGCRFAARCTQAWALCHEQVPPWMEIGSGQGVRCHLYSDAAKQDVAAQPDSGLASNLPGDTDGKGAPSAPPVLLQVTDLQIHFPIRKGLLQRTVGQVKAVDGVSLEIAAGKTLALVGESGCGKTTVGKALLQLIKPTAGAVRFSGHELTGLSAGDLRAYRSGMQMVFQDPFASLNPKMRVAEILQEGMDALNIGHDSSARQQRIDELLDQVGLVRTAKWRYPHEFSGGQRQRIAIARALAVNPKLLICDEPTSALDVSVQAQILNLISMLQKELGLSYLFITHNLAVVDYLAHEVCVMYLGRIVERGSVDDVLRSPRHPYTQALLSAVPHIKKNSARQLIRLAGEMPSPANPPQGCHFHPRCHQAIEICRSSYPQESILEASIGSKAAHRAHCHLLG